MGWFQEENDTFDTERGALVIGLGLIPAPTAMAEGLAAAARAGRRMGDMRALPHWTVLVVDGLPLNSDDKVRRQLVMSADVTAALLGQLQGWHAMLDRELATRAVADQLDALRADAAARWASDHR